MLNALRVAPVTEADGKAPDRPDRSVDAAQLGGPIEGRGNHDANSAFSRSQLWRSRMPVVLWWLGVPLSLVLLLFLFGAI
jgi:hypothetical protein